MGLLQNPWDINDYLNAKAAFLSEGQWTNYQVLFRKFLGYETKNPGQNSMEQFRVPKYLDRADHVWMSSVRVFDTVKGGYFTTGDLDVNSFFQMFGYTPAYVLPNGKLIKEYAGDQLIWNGKLWIVSDQVEPVQFGTIPQAVWWRTVLRRADRTGQGVTPGPG